MANKKHKKKAQPAAEAAQSSSKVEAKKAASPKAKEGAKASKPVRADKAKVAKAKKKDAKPGIFARAKKHISSIISEMHRVTWPSKKELINYSVAVCVSLVVVGVAIALLDAVISEGLALFAGLRG